MTGAVAVFVKTPGLSPVKTRLAESVGKDSAQKFHEYSCVAVESVLQEAIKTAPSSLTGYWAIAEKNGMKHPAWKNLSQVYQGEGTLGQRLARVYSELIDQHSYVIFIGADCPQISSRVLLDAASHLASGNKFVMGNAEDGGFYLFGGAAPLDESLWVSVPYSDWQTADILKTALNQIAPVKLMPANFDVDNVEELKRLAKLLASKKDLLPGQSRLSEWLRTQSF